MQSVLMLCETEICVFAFFLDEGVSFQRPVKLRYNFVGSCQCFVDKEEKYWEI